MSDYLPCPQCSAADAQKIKFSWWGGVLGPWLFNHVKCIRCGSKYNGKTGKSNTTAIVIYTLAACLIFGTITFILVFSLTLLPHILNASQTGNPLKSLTASSTSPTLLTSSDGQSQMTFPAGWMEVQNLNPRATLQAAKASDEMYFIVITRSRKDIKLSLDKLTELTRREFQKTLQSPQLTPPQRIAINAQQAMQYEVGGLVNGINLGYVNTVIQMPKNFHQIIGFTLSSGFEKNKGALMEIIQTFKETGPEGSGQ